MSKNRVKREPSVKKFLDGEAIRFNEEPPLSLLSEKSFLNIFNIDTMDVIHAL